MTAFSIPSPIEAVFHNFRTAEFSTISKKDGTPITWPVTVLWDSQAGEFIASTSIGLPQKAFNIRSNPKVSLLFSEPKASGLVKPPAVLVQGDASVSESITDVEELEALWEKIYRFQPPSKVTSATPLSRMMMDWYYMRLKIHIAPRKILYWENADFSQAPREVSHVG
jgi:hypothetical protein